MLVFWVWKYYTCQELVESDNFNANGINVHIKWNDARCYQPTCIAYSFKIVFSLADWRLWKIYPRTRSKILSRATVGFICNDLIINSVRPCFYYPPAKVTQGYHCIINITWKIMPKTLIQKSSVVPLKG